jgi:hypothetical protein
MRSGLPTEVPPYFWTINAMMLAARLKKVVILSVFPQ